MPPRTDWTPLTHREADEQALTKQQDRLRHGHRPGTLNQRDAVGRAALGLRGREVVQTKTQEGDSFTPIADPAVLLDWQARLLALQLELAEAGGKWSWGESRETKLRQAAKVLGYALAVVKEMAA